MGMEITPKGRGMEQQDSGEVDPETAQAEAAAKQCRPGDGGSQHIPEEHPQVGATSPDTG